MVGFGSSLRLSRRRGWEDAYLDYQSLRLLLTQIEAVYEEEDWRRDGDGDGDAADPFVMDGRLGLASDSDVDANNGRHANDEDAPGLKQLWGKTWRMANIIMSGKRYQYHQSYSSKTSSSRTRRRWYKSSRGTTNSTEEEDKDNTDYRDELFLVSDEDVAYGCWGEIDDDDDDDDEWEDEDDGEWEDGDEACLDDEEGQERQAYNEHGESGEERHDEVDEQEETYSPRTEKENSTVEECAHVKNEQSMFTSPVWVKNLTTRTPKQSEKPESEIMEDIGDCNSPGKSESQQPYHTEMFTGSPGVLEAGYETFAAAAARSGEGAKMMIIGSPPEQGEGGWLSYIPRFFSFGGKRQQPTPEVTSSFSGLNRDDSMLNSSPLVPPVAGKKTRDIIASDSPDKYTHFAETFRRSPSSKQSSSMAGSVSSSSQKAPVLDAAANNNENAKTPVKTNVKSITVQATAVGKKMPLTPLTPPMSPVPERLHTSVLPTNHKSSAGVFGVSLSMLPTESSELLFRSPSSSPNKSPEHVNYGLSQFYSFKGEDFDYDATDECERYSKSYKNENNKGRQSEGSKGSEYDGGDEEEPTESSNMISFYSGRKDGYFSVRSPNTAGSSLRYHGQYLGKAQQNQHRQLLPFLPLVRESSHDTREGNFIFSFLTGSGDLAETKSIKANQGMAPQNRQRVASRSSLNELGRNQRAVTRQKRGAARAAKGRQIRLRRKRRKLRQREHIPLHLRRAHIRAASITERFRGLLRAEVEKVILFANSRLGELSDTIGSLRYSSYEESPKEYPLADGGMSLADGGMHHLSSSDSDGDSGIVSGASFSSDEQCLENNQQQEQLDAHQGHSHTHKSDMFNDEIKKQILLRDRLRIRRKLFEKADFLGDDFSLLSAVDEADAYSAVGVELMHLLKYVCVNIIATRKICKKHDHLRSNRMLGGYYHSLNAKEKRSQRKKSDGQPHLFHPCEATQPQFGGILSNQTASQSSYILGIYDKRIQHVANSTTMQAVSSSLAIALADFEASQTRSNFLGLFRSSKDGNVLKNSEYSQHEVPCPKHNNFTTSRLKDAVSHQISGYCFRGDDESTIASKEDCNVENASATVAQQEGTLTRLQFVVTSIFGLREAARFKSVPFEQYSSRLFMISSGPNVTGDGLDGCSKECLNFFRNYNPDAAYTLSMEAIYTALVAVGRGKDGVGGVMVASLAAATEGYDEKHVAAAMSMNPKKTGEDNNVNFQYDYQNILRLNSLNLILYLANYYIIFPTAHLYSKSLGSITSTAVLIGASNVSSLFSSFFHSLLISRHSFIRKHIELSNFRLPLCLCSVSALAGNLLFSYALKHSSFITACIGRLLIGFGSADILNRHLLSTILPPSCINTEVARLVRLSMITIALAFVLGSLFDLEVRKGNPIFSTMPSPTPLSNTTFPITPAVQPFFLSPDMMPSGQRSLLSLQSLGHIMSFLWFLHIIGIVFFFEIPKSVRKAEPGCLTIPPEEDFDSETETNPFSDSRQEVSHGDVAFEKLQTMSRKTVKHQSNYTYKESIANIRENMFSDIVFPTSTAILFIVKISTEIILNSCGSMTGSYFNWSGARSGLFMGFVAAMILPVNQTLAKSQNLSERNIIKVALKLGRCGVLLMVNYESLFFFLTRKVSAKHRYYDGVFGRVQYVLSFAIIFCVLMTLESATLILMSKSHVAPRHTHRYSIDKTFTVSFVSALGRLIGDAFLLAMDTPSFALFKDPINSVCLLLMISFGVGLYLVRKHYFFLT